MTSGSGPAGAIAARPGRGLRFLDVAAGLVAAGMLIVGVLLLVSALVAPGVLPAAGLGPADGPGWSRVGLHLLVGAAGELVVHRRPSWPPPVRVAADLAVLLAAAGVIWWAWWA